MLGAGRHGGAWVFAFGGLALAVGCGHTKLEAPCRSNGDCATGERCEATTSRTREAIFGPCPYTSCQSTADCTNGYVCGPLPTNVTVQPGQGCAAKACLPPCDPGDAATCPANQICRDTGLCTVVQCDEPGGVACPEHWRCDPEAAPSETPGYSDTTTPVTGTTVVDPKNPTDVVAHGCVRKRCTEDDGYACAFNYTCKESEAANGTGCVATPCEELGGCSDDAIYICTPTSTGQRYNGTDVNGCAFRNCEEGLTCTIEPSPWHFCDPTDATADAIGCAVVPCTEGSPCPTQWVCDPTGQFVDRQGCVRDPALSAGGASGDAGTGSSSGGAGSSNGGSTAAMGSGAISGDSGASSGGSTGGGSASAGRATGGDTSQGGDSASGGTPSASGGTPASTGGSSGASTSGDEPGPGRCVAE